ncbi:cytochrome P450 [Novosphingobium nitrogenifigens DSM 19370]|uniref:Cytochrome P450 n=1 Tax=Novosphingobium nitrogenifigens DSM 19370 TaxID=983920 RepID=F1Z504_9SPHN|nr:cytochrome P450 [Novosphingobium nitrogenifigens]EGD60043.1 cytochrome P450 [Novosphingobium nitrogenifigens DSM 19370]
MPFGGGAHMCLGLHFAMMVMKVLLHHVVARYRLEPLPGPTHDWQPWPIARPRDGLRLEMRRIC